MNHWRIRAGRYRVDAVMRHAGLPEVVMNEAYRRQVHSLLAKLVKEQGDFFRSEECENRGTVHWLETWHRRLLQAAIAATLVYVGAWVVDYSFGTTFADWIKNPVTICAAGFPALAAALYAAGYHGEYAQQEGRYLGMALAMDGFELRLHGWLKATERGDPGTAESLGALALDIVETLLQELYQWRGMFQPKQVEHH